MIQPQPFQKVLVTGAAGFIGSTLVDCLLAQGKEVVGLDNFDPYYDPQQKRDNLEAALQHENFQMYEADILDVPLLERVFAQHSFDVVVHLAAKAGVRPSIENPAAYFQVNVEGTLNVLNQLRVNPKTRLVMASSSSVYGNNLSAPFVETTETSQPVSPYAASKKAGEVLAYSYAKLYGIPMSLLRFFTVYGPRQRPEMAIAMFFKLIQKGEQVPMFGDGSTARDYTYVGDIVDGILRSMKRTEGFEIYNLGNSSPVSLLEMIQAVGVSVGKSAKIQELPEQAGDVTLTCANIQKAERQLGFHPNTSLEQGLSLYSQWLSRAGQTFKTLEQRS
ncbi:MAG: GDP-mannose 4,6-dehydratase [Planctomycetota bacterium]|nr:GDP-mannose 4,6-dehydratase [Planctomycetota bacterium]MDA1114746.1 GDP-mannose 4,6-dehydratase [Planctomycetota bacterium]